MILEREQEELLVWMVEASRDVLRAQRTWFLALIDGPSSLHGPGGVREVVETDLYELADAGLLRAGPSGKDYTITAHGHAYYGELKQRGGHAVDRQEAELRRFIDAEAFQRDFPAAYARWVEAEQMLWMADSEREFTTIGHKAREAMQEFATELIARYEPPEPDPEPSHVNRRIGAVIAYVRASLGDARSQLLTALGDIARRRWR